MKIYVSDTTDNIDTYNYAVSLTYSKISDYDYRVSGSFIPISWTEGISNICGKNGTDIDGLIYTGSDDYVNIYSWGANGNTIDGETRESCSIEIAKGHATSCRTYIVDETAGSVSSSDIYANAMNLTAVNLVESLYYNGFKLATRSTTGLTDGLNEGIAESYLNRDIGICYSHGANSHTELIGITRLDLISAIGAGDNTGNKLSYGDGLEYYLNCTEYGCPLAESWATPIIGGMLAKLMTDHNTWNFYDARQGLRQTATLWDTGWIKDGGFGAVNYTSASSLTDETLLPMSPLRQDITTRCKSVLFEWKNSPQNLVNGTMIARFTSEPTRSTTPNTNEIIYSGSDEHFIYDEYIEGGIYWFTFYSQNDNGYSRVESYDKYQVTVPRSLPKIMVSVNRDNINIKALAENVVI